MNEEANRGFQRAVKEAGRTPNIAPNVISSELGEHIDRHITAMFKDIDKKISEKMDAERAFNSSEYRIRFLADHVMSKAHWYSYVKTAKALGIKEVKVNFSPGSPDANNYGSRINTSHFSLDDIPAFHPYCKCSLML